MPQVAILSSTARLPRRLVPSAVISPVGFLVVAWTNAFFLWAILLSGGLVRLTSSGLGCPTGRCVTAACCHRRPNIR